LADDPRDVFDTIADDIRRQQDEIEAADQVRAEREKQKRKPDGTAEPARDPHEP
jgi:hypothetical protein